ncbi:alpha-ketoglutarate transporter, partial [Streptomyces sp. NPDC050600]
FWYVAGCAAVSLVVYLTMRETRDIDLGRVGGGALPGQRADGPEKASAPAS